MNKPSNENLQTFADYIKGKRAGEQITISGLGNTLPSKGQAGRLLNYLAVIGVVEKRRGGGYYLPGEGCPETILTDLIEHGPIIYPQGADEPVKIYGRLKVYPPAVRLHVYGCKILVLPSTNTVQEAKEQIVQGTTLIVPPIKLDDVNRYVLKKFFSEMKLSGGFEYIERIIVRIGELDSDFESLEEVILTPVSGVYLLSASNIAQTAARPIATLNYLSENLSVLDIFRESVEILMEHEKEHSRRLGASYPEATDEFFWSDYNRNVKPFVDENSDRIKEELVDKVMGLWHPKTLESKVEIPNVGVSEQPRRKKSIFGPILKSLFRN